MKNALDIAISLIKRFEGYSSKAYLCPAGVWTIGYGSTKGVTKGMTIGIAEAEKLLQKDLEISCRAIAKLITVPLNDNQMAVLIDFTYNLGSGRLQSSTLRQKLNRGEYEEVPKELLRWNKAGGKVLKGLSIRREAEVHLWNSSLPIPTILTIDPNSNTKGWLMSLVSSVYNRS